jgi:chromosome partitioning protein
MTVLALANQKGGVGKTTTAINLGACLAARGRRVLLVDVDPQANATAGLGLGAPPARSIYAVLIEEATIDEVTLDTVQPDLRLVPSASDLAGAEVELVPAMAREYRLRRALDAARSAYDLVIIDCPPSLSLLTINALAAAEQVIVPVQCEYLPLEGLGQLVQTLDLVRHNLNQNLHLLGLLLTMFDGRTNLSQQVAQEVRSHFPNTFRAVIPRSVRLSEAPSYGLPICAYDAASRGARAYEALADEVLSILDKGPAPAESRRARPRTLVGRRQR